MVKIIGVLKLDIEIKTDQPQSSAGEGKPLYPISIVSELLGIHPETIRVWERSGVIKPSRRGGKRFFSETDLKRLRFVQKLISQGLNLPGVIHYLRLYNCWESNDCPSCVRRVKGLHCAKACWKEEDTCCQTTASVDTCSACKFRKC
jgi:MerR family transcriptional regulator, heat shock protein HspR